MNFAQKIKELRIDHDTTQAEIAKILGTNQSYYAKYENGIRPLPIDRLKILCEYYQVSADYILDLPYGLSWPRIKKEGSDKTC